MKRHGNLWNQLISDENILLAFQRAIKGKSTRKAVIKYSKNIPLVVSSIKELLISKTFHTSKYHHKTIYEPKERLIYILPFYPDRIVQHALMNILEPIFVSMFIKDSYSCIKGKGTHIGSIRTMQFVKRNKYCLKCDVRKFYPSLDQEVLMRLIERKIKDKNVLWLIRDIVFSFPGGKNVPIGNYTSQWFGNHYLHFLDLFIKQDLHVKDYIRYCDDFLLFSDDKAFLNNCLHRIESFFSNNLLLSFSKKDLFPVSRGVDFLGYRHFPTHVLMRKSTMKRHKRKFSLFPNLLSKGKITALYAKAASVSMLGWAKHANCYNFINSIKVYLTQLEAINE